MGAGISLTCLPVLRTLSLLFGFLVQPQYESFCLDVLHHVLFCLAWRPPLFFFLKRKQRGSRSGGGGGGNSWKNWREGKQ